MITKPRLHLRKALIGTALAAVIGLTLASPAAPAGAAFNPHLATVSSATSCNSSTRKITFGVSISLDSAYSQGTWVTYRFRYYKVNSAGYRTTAVHGANWLGPVHVDTWTTHNDIMGPYSVNSPVTLNGGSVRWAGRLHAQVEIGVWTGYRYANSGWIDISSYTNFYPTSLGMERTELSNCLTAW